MTGADGLSLTSAVQEVLEEVGAPKSVRGVVAKHFDDIAQARVQGASWRVILQAMEKAGIRKPDGTVFEDELELRRAFKSVKDARDAKTARQRGALAPLTSPVPAAAPSPVATTVAAVPEPEAIQPQPQPAPTGLLAQISRIAGSGAKALDLDGGEAATVGKPRGLESLA